MSNYKSWTYSIIFYYFLSNFVASLASTNALKCYQCTNCYDPFNDKQNSTLVTCPTGFNTCIVSFKKKKLLILYDNFLIYLFSYRKLLKTVWLELVHPHVCKLDIEQRVTLVVLFVVWLMLVIAPINIFWIFMQV